MRGSGKWAVLLTLAAIANPALSLAADPAVSVNTGQRYITIQTYWSDMTEAQRQQVIGSTVTLIKNEIAAKAPLLNKDPSLTNALLAPAFMNQISAEITRYLDSVDNMESSKSGLLRAAADLLPRALLISVGGSAGFHWMIGGKASLDLGLVVMFPSFKTVIDTADRNAQNEPAVIENDQLQLLDATLVGIPHGYFGIGVGGGGTFSVNVAGIWGNMSSASDFEGAIIGASGNIEIPVPAFIPFPDGADLDIDVVANLGHIFGVVSIGMDKGAEAAATADLSAGAVLSWQELITPISDPKTLVQDVEGFFGGNKNSGNDNDNGNGKGDNHSEKNGNNQHQNHADNDNNKNGNGNDSNDSQN